MAEIWSPPTELSEQEEYVLKLSKRRKLYRFFRLHRHEIVDESLQGEMVEMFSDMPEVRKALPPGQMVLAMLMQAAFGVPDHEVPTLTAVDLRWQMVLDCMGEKSPLMSQGSVFNFRMRAIEHGWAHRLVEHTVKLARETRGYSATALRSAFDSSPLHGAGRVEDTFNLIGRAAGQVAKSAAEQLGMTVEQVAQEAGIPLVNAKSVKAALDLDWNEPKARRQGLQLLLEQVSSLREWLRAELATSLDEPPLNEQLETLDRLIEQDTEPDPDGGGRRIKDGTAPDRQISLSDPDMRHGRKSSSKRFNGYKRHIAVDLQTPGLICAVAVTPANQPEGEASTGLFEDLEAQGLEVESVQVDLAYAEAAAVRERKATGLRVVAKPRSLRNGPHFTKAAFEFDFEGQTVTCPGGTSLELRLGSVHRFPASSCGACELRGQCTSANPGTGRSLSVHPDEPEQHRRREMQKTPEGRAAFRQRVPVEHALARVGQTQGTRARYRGLEKNEFHLACHAAVNNCYVLDGILREAA